MEKYSFSVNGLALDDSAGRWCLEAATLRPGKFSQKIAQIELAGVDGVRIAAAPKLGAGAALFSVLVDAGTPAALDSRVSVLQAACTGFCTLTYSAPGVKPRSTRAVANSFTPEKITRAAALIAIDWLIPDPVWIEEDKQGGSVSAGGPRVLAPLSGGSAPAEVEWQLPADASFLQITCDACGGEVLTVKNGDRIPGGVWVTGWDVPALKSRVEAFARVCPSHAGIYSVTVKSDGGAVNWRAGRAFI